MATSVPRQISHWQTNALVGFNRIQKGGSYENLGYDSCHLAWPGETTNLALDGVFPSGGHRGDGWG
jgi:hypothetical protein